jgi:hypothetical protein
VLDQRLLRDNPELISSQLARRVSSLPRLPHMSRLLLRALAAQRVKSGDRGNVLILALVTAIVLTLGLAALSARTNSGLFGAAFQSKNREARDIAESVITNFIDVMNRPNNRYLLAAGTTTWAAADASLRNRCTGYDRTTFAAKDASATPAQIDIADVSKLAQSTTWQKVDPSDSSKGEYLIEEIQYLDQSRTPYDQNRRLSSDPDLSDAQNPKVLESIRSGLYRGLIRVTVQARFTRDGRTSYARVARELEVVPKCCFRSFGNNKGAGARWGRDLRDCVVEKPGSGGNGIIAFEDASSNGKSIAIIGEDGKPVTNAICLAGSTECEKEPSGVSLNGVSFNPQAFEYRQRNPIFERKGCILHTVSAIESGAACQTTNPLSGLNALTVSDAPPAGGSREATAAEMALLNGRFSTTILGQTFYTAWPGNWIESNQANMYWVAGYPQTGSSSAPIWHLIHTNNFKTTNAATDSLAAQPSGSPYFSGSNQYYVYYNETARQVQSCVRSSCSPLPCFALTSVVPSPYKADVSCRFSQLGTNNFSGKVSIDTSNARFNFFFEPGSTTTNYLGGAGNAEYLNVHCPGTTPSIASPCTTPISWTEFQKDCSSGGSLLCSNAGVTNRPFDTSELLNMYTTGSGQFYIKGTQSGAGFNIYAPNATVKMYGGGGAGKSSFGNANFMGRIWAGVIDLAGNVTIYTVNSNPAECQGTNINCAEGIAFIYDLKARSYTQASGF